MKAVVFLGSRNPEGRTARAVDALIEGMVSKGAEVDRVFLPDLTVERCRQCDPDGWGRCRDTDECEIEDDFQSLLESIRSKEILAFATPVYYSDMSESMFAFLHRLRRVSRNDSGGIKGKMTVGICVAGGGGGGAPACSANLQKILNGCGFDVLDIIPVRRQNLGLKKGVLRRTGRWLVDKAQKAQGG